MIQVQVGSNAEFNAAMYGMKHPGTLNFLQNQLATTYAITNQLTDAGRNFFASAAAMYDQFNGSEAMRVARAALRKVGHIFQSDVIRCIADIGGMQQAPLVMQRYIMAQPDVRQLWKRQMCDGYSDTYVDVHNGAIGQDHYDYRRVMDQVVEEFVDENGEDGWKTTHYFEELLPGDRKLMFDEKADVLSTWDVLKAMLKMGKEDPTSPFNASL